MSDDLINDIEYLEERYERAPDSRVFAPLADAYRKRGDFERAIAILEEGLKKYPDYVSAHVILGKCFYDKGATERAKVEFERVLEHDSENMVALKFMGDILYAEDKRDEALKYYQRLLSIDPTNKEVSKLVSEMKDEFEAKELSLDDGEKVKDTRPRELATMTLAGIYAAQGYYNKALKIYREILSKEPQNREAQDMVEKLQGLIDSSEDERKKAFDDDVLTISLDDVSEDMAEATSGPGGGEVAEEEVVPMEEEVGEEVGETEPSEGEEMVGEEEVKEETEQGGEDRSGSGEGKELKKEDIELFKEWIKKMKGN